MSGNRYKILIADDHALFVEGLKALLQQNARWEIIGMTTDGSDVLETVRAVTPHLVLLDINMSKINGFELLKKIKAYDASIKTVMVSTYEEQHMIDKARESGADGYLRKNAGIDELTRCIETVQRNERFFLSTTSPQIAGDDQHPVVRVYKLSRREWEIVQLIRQGLTSKQVAEKLFLSRFTVEAHRKNIMHKLKVNNTVALISLLQKLNL